MRTIRSTLLLSAAALALTLASTSCSDRADENIGSDEDSTVVTDMFGEVEVPANPQRVVALGWSDAETALALGVQPVGASDWLAVGGNGLGPWVSETYDTDPTILGTYEVNMESVAALAPDLILWTRSTNDKTVYDQLSDIAPTVAAPEGTDIAYGTTWAGQTELVAEALGKVDEGKQLVAETEALFAETVTANPQLANKEVAVGTLYSGQIGAYVRGDTRVDFLEALGMTNSPSIQALAEPGKFSVELSQENVAALDADLTVMFPIGSGPEVITDNPSIQALPSARDGRLVVLGDQSLSNAFSAASVASTRYALTNAVPLFSAALQG